MYNNTVRGGQSHGQHAQNLEKFGCTIFELCERTDRCTDSSALDFFAQSPLVDSVGVETFF